MLLLRLFKNNRTAGLLFTGLASVALFLVSVMQAGTPTPFEGMPLYNLLFGKIQNYAVLNRLLALLHYWIIAYMLSRISFRYQLLENRSLMPSLFFLLLAFALPSARQLSPSLIGFLFFLWAYLILMGLPEAEKDELLVFRASLAMALGSLFYLPLICFIPLIWVSIATLHKSTWREWIYPLTAYVLLAVFLVSWYWGLKNDLESLWGILGRNLLRNGNQVVLHIGSILYFLFCLLLIGLGSLFMIEGFQTRKTMVQNIYQVFFFVFIGAVLFFVFASERSPQGLLYIAFPVSFLLANYFHRRKNHWVHELMLWMLTGLLVFLQIAAQP